MKEELINHLSTLLSYNVLGDIQYQNRFNGFIGELDCRNYMVNTRCNDVIDGGIFLPALSHASPLDNPVYFTVSSDDMGLYMNLYERIAKLGCKSMYFIKWDESLDYGTWEKLNILGVDYLLPVPTFQVYRYVKCTKEFETCRIHDFLSEFKEIRYQPRTVVSPQLKNDFSEKLSRFEFRTILGLYVQRLVFDGLIGFKRMRGIPADIDMIIKSKINGSLVLLEVKEKDLSKRPPVGFGMDLGRISFYNILTETTGMEVFYIVKQVSDQITRNFVSWRCINMRNFIEKTGRDIVEGGTGMRSTTSSNPTRICPVENFKVLEP